MVRGWKSRAVPIAIGLAWGSVVLAGLGAVHRYESTPGPAGVPPRRWPPSSRVRPEPGRPNLVLLAHPRCPCTRASLNELARIVSVCGNRATVHILFFQPGRATGEWGGTELNRRARAIPGVRVLDDPDGSEAACFGVATSGHLLLYDRDERLLFAGGVTAARGQAGPNSGSNAVIALLSGGSGTPSRTPVFGCPIHDRPN